MDRWDGPGVIRESGMIAKEQGHRVLGATVRILGLGVVGASAENKGEVPLIQA